MYHGFHKNIKVFKEMVVYVFTINQIHDFKDAKPPRLCLTFFIINEQNPKTIFPVLSSVSHLTDELLVHVEVTDLKRI